MTAFIRAGIVFLYTWLLLCLSSEGIAQQQLLRDPQTECGLYFSDSYNTQGTKVSDLTDDGFIEALSEIDTSNPPKSLALVGVDPAQVQEMRLSLKRTFAELQLKDIPVTVIRRIESFIANETGVFVKDGDAWKKVSAFDKESLNEKLAELGDVNQKEFLVVGLPMFGAKKKEIKQTLEANGITNYAQQSKLHAYLGKAWSQPVAAGKDFLQKARFMLPIREDLVRPSAEEKSSALQKILVPGALTFSVLLAQGQELNILVPVTIVNAANSWSNGFFRSSIGNWWRRSTNFFPSKFTKNLMLTSFFTSNLYWAGTGSLEKTSQMLTLMGWQNFVTTKWLSVIFNAMWRTPVSNTIFQWEAFRMQTADAAEATKIRAAGSALEKYVSYVMTQFYIYSLVTKSSLFNVIYSTTDGLQILPADYTKALDQTVLMNANIGHVSMAALGALAFVFMKKIQITDRLAAIALRIDRTETKITEFIKQPLGWIANLFRKPATMQEEPEQ